jgi:hypothetical protein
MAHFFEKEVIGEKIEKRSGFAEAKAILAKLLEERASKDKKHGKTEHFMTFRRRRAVMRRTNCG